MVTSLVNHLKVRHSLNLRLPWLAGDAFFLFIIILFDRKILKIENFGILKEFKKYSGQINLVTMNVHIWASSSNKL